MKNKKWSKLVQIEKNTEKGHTESTEIHRKNKFSHRKHGNTQKRSSHRNHGNTQKFFCAVGDFLSHTEITEIHRNTFAQWETSFLTRKSRKSQKI